MIQVITDPDFTFKTSFGSVYVQKGSCTQRNKSYHVHHGAEDQGWKSVSERTVYISERAADEITTRDTKRFWPYFAKETDILFLYDSVEKDVVGTINYTETPEAGKHPLEFWCLDDQPTTSGDMLVKPHTYHVGNVIIP